MALTSIGYAGTIGPGGWVDIQRTIGCRYAVLHPGHLRLGATTSGVTLTAGSAGGGGVYDTWDSQALVTLTKPSSGTSWWLIAIRRNWTSLASSLVAIPAGTTTPSSLPSRNTTMGVIDDQPLWLVSWAASSSTPDMASAIDLRLIGRGPSNYVATHDMVMSYFLEAGATLRIGRVDWVCTLSPAGTLKWEAGGVLGASGSNSNGEWSQTPDGLMICSHRMNFPAKPGVNQSQRWYYPSPVPFVTIPFLTATQETTAPANMDIGFDAPGVYSALVTFNRVTNVQSTVRVGAIGRWK